jgi:hypothetical protein
MRQQKALPTMSAKGYRLQFPGAKREGEKRVAKVSALGQRYVYSLLDFLKTQMLITYRAREPIARH